MLSLAQIIKNFINQEMAEIDKDEIDVNIPIYGNFLLDSISFIAFILDMELAYNIKLNSPDVFSPDLSIMKLVQIIKQKKEGT